MALINCPECQKEISNEAKTCPNCGFDLHREEKANIKKTVLSIIGIIIAIILIVVIYDACTVSPEEASEKLRQQKEEVQRIQDEIDDLKYKKRVNEWLIDQYED